MIGAAQQFALTEQGLSWRFAGRSGVWPYADIAAIRLSFRPVSMQAKRFRADITHRDGRRLSVVSTSWQTATLMAPQSEAYRAFIVALHARLAASGSAVQLTAGLGRIAYGAALGLIALLAVAMAGLLVRALLIREWTGALFLVGFAAMFAWYVGGFITRNQPRSYTFAEIPVVLLP
ncbi:hypothetical protein [Bradyrhizobium sp. STM 3809]|uniref:hypothetical protein n=1 Tax=Bradyrhizobium sp. STM 3809 TaxID=551936 RepID=UPI001F0A31D2|nr:hypothetical protein [Bradyrhizobium sp. STM 3809]